MLVSQADLIWYEGIGDRTLDVFVDNLTSLVLNHLRFCYQRGNEVKDLENSLAPSWELPVLNVSTHSNGLSLWGQVTHSASTCETMGRGQGHRVILLPAPSARTLE
jgi:hypothetical protein